MRGAVGRVGGPGVLPDRRPRLPSTRSPACSIRLRTAAPFSQPRPPLPAQLAVPGCGPPSRGGSGPRVTSVRASSAESAVRAGLPEASGGGLGGQAGGGPASGSLTALSRAFRPGGAVAGRRDFLPRPSRYPLGRGQEVMEKKQPSGRRGWALLRGEMALGPAGLSAVKGCRSEKRTGKSDLCSASRLLRNRVPHLGSSHRPLAPLTPDSGLWESVPRGQPPPLPH